MRATLMVYGATGFTGRLIVRSLLERGLRPLLGGRDETRLAAAAGEFGLETCVATLDDADALARAAARAEVVVHVAGPFVRTAVPMAEACLRASTHYLDVGGEALGIEALARFDAEARRAGLMIMPAIGFDVVASDCLCAHVARRLPDATRLELGISALGVMSPGSAKSFVEYAGQPIRVRRGGRLVDIVPGSLERVFDYGPVRGRRLSSALSWGDTASAWYTTGIPNITTYFETTPQLRAALAASRFMGPLMESAAMQAWMKSWADVVSAGPGEEQRATRRMTLVAEAIDAAGRCVASRTETPDSYAFTAATAARIAERVVAGDLEPGFQTPARVYGADFALSFDGVVREDLEAA